MKKLLFILLTCFGLTALADINLGVTEKVKTVTTSYNALVSDDNIMVDAGGGNVTVGLPSASLKRGKVIKVFKTDSGYNAVIVNGVSMTFQNEYVKLYPQELHG